MPLDRLIWTEASVSVRRAAPEEIRQGHDLAAAGLAFLALGGGFMTALMIAAAMAAGPDLARGAISDFGVTPATALLFNGALVATGTLAVAGGLLLHRVLASPAILALHLAAGLGAGGAGLVTLASPGLHGVFALLAFLGFNLLPLALAPRLALPLRAVGVGLGTLGLAFVVLMMVGDAGHPGAFGPLGHGGAERMIVYPPMIWLMALGGHLMGPVRLRGGPRW